MKTLAIIGASGHGKVVADAALSCGLWENIVFYDDAWPTKKTNGNSEIVGDTTTLLKLDDKPEVVIAIGDNNVRLEKQQLLMKAGFTPVTVIHAAAVVSSEAMVGQGSVIMAGAVINACAAIGACCIINTNAVVEHDCILGDAVHISPGACLAGGVKVGEGSWVGISASVIQLISIGKNVVVGAGAAVVTNLRDNVTAVGVPAKIIKL